MQNLCPMSCQIPQFLNRNCLQQFGICRNLLSGMNDDDVINHDLFAWDGGDASIAHHHDWLVIIDLVEDIKLLTGLILEIEGKPCGYQDSHEDAYRFEEYLGAFMQPLVLIKRDTNRQQTRYQ